MSGRFIGGILLLLGGVFLLATAAMGYVAIFEDSAHWTQAAVLTGGLGVALIAGSFPGWWWD